MFRLLMYVVMYLACLGATCLVLGAFVFYYYGMDLPDHKQLRDYVMPQTTYLMTSDERLITSYARERRIFLALDQTPQLVINAFLAAEDKNFYDNPGIDIMGILRAALNNLYGQHLSGGSTITQQLAKNFFLTNERTVTRKLKELILAFRITKSLDKDRILELYLNKIYMGNGTYGIAAAAVGYFNKSIEDVNISEAAMLAAMPKSPSKFDPWRNEDHSELTQRRNWVINRMMDDGYINKYESIAARERPIALSSPTSLYDSAYYFGEEVRKEIESMYGQDCLFECGLTVHTTINTEYQELAYSSLRNGLEKFDKGKGYRGPIVNIKDSPEKFDDIVEKFNEEHTMKDLRLALVTDVSEDFGELLFYGGRTAKIYLQDVDWKMAMTNKPKGKPKNMRNVMDIGDVIMVGGEPYQLKQVPKINGAIVVLDTKTGRVLAMVGGYDYKNNKFNRATQAHRQPGSVFKPLVYLTALERQIVKPSTIIVDEPISVDLGYNLPLWSPRNFKDKYYGAVPVRRGLEQSINSVTVKLIIMSGLDNVIDTAKKMNVYSGSGKYFSIALGSEAIDPLSITNAYAIIASGGRGFNPTTIELVEDSKGRRIYKRDKRECSMCAIHDGDSSLSQLMPPEPDDIRKIIVDPIACYQVLSMMEGVVKFGTGKGARISGKHVAGKTGTTNDSKDAWFVGLTNEVTVGVYVGYDEPSPLGGEAATGSRIALPIVHDFIKNANVAAGPFPVPLGVTLVKINRLSGSVANNESNENIMEAFRMGTEPYMNSKFVKDNFGSKSNDDKNTKDGSGYDDIGDSERDILALFD